jgi:antirestriction protein ArdC
MAKYNYKSDGRTAEDKALDTFASLLIDRIKTIQEDWTKPWVCPSGPGSQWPKSLAGRPYGASNALMLMLHAEKEGYEVPVYATFERIVSLNYDKNRKPLVDKNGEPLPKVCVLRGAKSFPIFLTTFTIVDKETKEKIKYDDYKELSEEEKAKYNVYPKSQVFNVFNVTEQTNLKDARPEMYQKFVDENTVKLPERNGEMFRFEPIDVAIKNDIWYCPIHLENQDKAYYRPSDNTIHLPPAENFVDGESFVSTLFHEATHERQNALGLLKSSTFGTHDYAVSELEAEMSAALICQKYGITKLPKAESCAYLKSWLEHLDESPDYLKNVLTNVKKESSSIMQRIDLIQSRLDQGKDLTCLEEPAEKVAFAEKDVTEKQPELVAEQSVGYHRHR